MTTARATRFVQAGISAKLARTRTSSSDIRRVNAVMFSSWQPAAFTSLQMMAKIGSFYGRWVTILFYIKHAPKKHGPNLQ